MISMSSIHFTIDRFTSLTVFFVTMEKVLLLISAHLIFALNGKKKTAKL